MAKRLTYDFIKNYIESNKGYKLLSTNYINSKDKLEIQCPENHIIKMTFNGFQRSSRCSTCELLSRQKYSDEYLLNSLLEYFKKYQDIPSSKDFTKLGLPSNNVYNKRFGSIKNTIKLLNIEIPEGKKKLFSDYKGVTDEELLNILIDYSKNIGFPTQRKFKSKNNLPSSTLYFRRFGSFRNAIILANIEIPKDRLKWFDREFLSDDEMLKLLQFYTNEKLKKNIYLLTNEDIDSNINMPHSSTYNTRFGGVIEAYKLIGIDYKGFNNNALEQDMIKKYKELYQLLNRTPHSRDIEEYSHKRVGFYSMGAYEEHFGGIYDLQTYCELIPTVVGKHKSKKEMIEDLQELYERLERIPTQRDINMCNWMSSSSKYISEFGSYINALLKAGINGDFQNKKCAITPSGNYCRSSYEYDFCLMLEKNNFRFTQEDYYYNYINNFDRKFRFDFKLDYNENLYFVEIFGIMEYEWYRNKANYKKQLCKENNLNLIDLYKEDFLKNDIDDLYKLIIYKINNINLQQGGNT